MNGRSPEILRPTLIAGASFGTLGALPVFGLINCACCALVIGCGVCASYLYARECRSEGAGFRPANGAFVGLVAGGFYAMVHTLVAAIIRLLIGDRIARQILDRIQRMPSIPAESREMIGRLMGESASWTFLALVGGFLVTLFVAAVFSTAGGLVGGALFTVAPERPSSTQPTSGGPADIFPSGPES